MQTSNIDQLIQAGRLDEAQALLPNLETQVPRDQFTYSKMVTLAYAGRYREAYQLALEVMRTTPTDMTAFCLARLSVAVGEWFQGLELFDRSRAAGLFGGPFLTTRRPLWNGESLLGRKILLSCEGGLGDIVCFARFAMEFEKRGASVIVAVDGQMIPLLKSMPSQTIFIDPKAVDWVEYDYWVPALSCPRLLGLRPEQIRGAPYLNCEAAARAPWKILLASGRPKVGVVWRGQPGFAEDGFRSLDESSLQPLFDNSDVDFYTLQPTRFGAKNVSDRIGSPMQLAGFLSEIDLLISVDTGPAHLAAALGTPTILLNRVMGWFTFGYKAEPGTYTETPWYAAMKLLNQKNLKRWDDEIATLKKFLSSQSQVAALPRELNKLYHPDSPPPSREKVRLVDTRMGAMLTAPNDFFVGKALELYGEYSEPEAAEFRKLIQPGDHVVELGAHLGAHSAVFAKATGPKGRVLAFEPQKFLLDLLRANMAMLGFTWVEARGEVVSAAAGETQVPELDYGQVGNFGALELHSPPVGGVPTSVITLDSLNLTRVDFIKLDIEGMELSALRGAQATIARCRPQLWIEVDRADQRPAIEALLGEWRYKIEEKMTLLFNPRNFNGIGFNAYGDSASFNILATPESSS